MNSNNYINNNNNDKNTSRSTVNAKQKQNDILYMLPKMERHIEDVLGVVLKLPRVEKFNIGQEMKLIVYDTLKNILLLSKIDVKGRLGIANIGLNLTLNSKTQIFKLKQGVNFCGYKIDVRRMRIRDKGKKKLVSKLKWINYNFERGNISILDAKRYFAGHLGYIKHADISGIIKKYLS